jgi:hypothetical protein
VVDHALTRRNGGIQQAQAATDVAIVPNVFMITAIGGFAVRMKNRTGVNSVKGKLVIASNAAFNGVNTAPSNSDRVLGAMYEDDIATGEDCWVVVGGAADVKLEDSVGSTRGQWVGSSPTAGRALTKDDPASVSERLQEIGHCVQTIAGDPAGALCRIIMHFN